MARPKLGEGETQRLQLKISDEELAEIDDWRFENRIGSRSEAVRRLCRIGLTASLDLRGLFEHAQALTISAAWEHKEIVRRLYELEQSGGEKSDEWSALEQFADTTHDLFDRSFIIGALITGTYNEVIEYSGKRPFAESEKEALRQRHDAIQMIEAYEDRLRRINEAPHAEPSDKEKWLRLHLDRMLEFSAKMGDPQAEVDGKSDGGLEQ